MRNRLGLIPSERRRVAGALLDRPAEHSGGDGIDGAAQTLSGGNQQRVVLAKWLATRPKVLILDGPTIGVDIRNKAGIHEVMRSLADDGMAILLISDEMPEVYFNCDRVLHMRDGRIAGEYVPGVGQRARSSRRRSMRRSRVAGLRADRDAHWRRRSSSPALILSLSSPYFLTVPNLVNLVEAYSVTAILAAGVFVVLVCGGIDISFTATAAAAQYFAATLATKHGMPLVPTLLALGAASASGSAR